MEESNSTNTNIEQLNKNFENAKIEELEKAKKILNRNKTIFIIFLIILIIEIGFYIFIFAASSIPSNCSGTDELDEATIKAANVKITPYLGDKVKGVSLKSMLDGVQNANDNYAFIHETLIKVIVDSNAPISDETRWPSELAVSAGVDDTALISKIKQKIATGKFYSVEATYGSQGRIIAVKIGPAK